MIAELASGAINLVVGTHALAEEAVAFGDLGLVVIDEQHRFGVLQRATLRAKGVNPDVLVMTATPIPRTLALTTYGDLDVSIIRELPPGRQPITTVMKTESRRDEVYQLARRELDAGRQVYVVYPLVEDSEKVDLRAATAMADHLQAEIFPDFTVALLHGRLKQDEKDRVMGAFARGDVHVLVVDDRRRGRGGRAERVDDGHRARGAVRAVAVAPVARAHRPRPPPVHVRPAVSAPGRRLRHASV